MAQKKGFFQDRLMLLLFSSNIFFALLVLVLLAFRLGDSQSGTYITQYRSNLGLDAYNRGNSTEFFIFGFFAIMTVLVHTLLSRKIYDVRRGFSIAVMCMGTIILLMLIRVSDALLLYK